MVPEYRKWDNVSQPQTRVSYLNFRKIFWKYFTKARSFSFVTQNYKFDMGNQCKKIATIVKMEEGFINEAKIAYD